MKIFVVLVAAFIAATSSVCGTELPSGRIVEVHSVEVYTGGCTASAQATMGGAVAEIRGQTSEVGRKLTDR